MTEYSEMIERTRKEILAEKWARGVKHMHVHSLKSMWYETRPQDTDSGSVMDITYNDGSIERKLNNGAIIFMTEEKLTGKELVDAWERTNVESK